MPIALTCDCGARFELDGALAGRTVHCPECLQRLEAPLLAPANAAVRTSLLALASIVLALAGAFTLVGSTLAILLGAAALVHVHGNRGRLAGGGLACCGIVFGLLSISVTLLLLSGNMVPIAAWMRQRTTAATVDTSGAVDVITRDGNVILRRPSQAWGRVQGDRSDDPAVGDFQQKRELLLANIPRHAFIDVARMSGLVELTEMTAPLTKDLQPHRPPLLGGDDDNLREPGLRPLRFNEGPHKIDPMNGWDGRECVVDLPRGGQTWRILVRVYKKADPASRETAYLFRAYAPKRHFDAVKRELEEALNSVQLPR
jgi:hypothetical protein